ncbi:MAG TPA: hypothetical protein VLW50_01085 [Streptosporangiaceae bacterium]|nr:hypothetical protein [Streptosporangiaceae bacterium]
MLAGAGLVTAEPGALPATLRADAGGAAVPGRAGPRLDSPLGALTDHLDRGA